VKKYYILIAVVVLAAMIWAFIPSSDTKADATEPCFYGYTKVDGVNTGGIDVYLGIGNQNYHVVSINDPAGAYAIGLRRDTGDYCLKARTDGDPQKGDTYQGIKQTQGKIEQDLDCTLVFPECEGYF
jgi:hypothetical protein